MCCLGNGILYSRKIWRALYLANWLFRSIGDFKFGDSPTTRDAFAMSREGYQPHMSYS